MEHNYYYYYFLKMDHNFLGIIVKTPPELG